MQTGTNTIHQSVKMPKIRLATLTGEVVHDLRSALDHLAWQLVLENGGTPIEGAGGTFWPILEAPPADPKRLNLTGGASVPAAALVQESQPYYPWDTRADWHPLWLLHRLSIIDKHQRVPIHGVGLDNIWFGSGGELPSFRWTAILVAADEYHAEFRLVPDDPAMDVEGRATAYVLVHEPPWHPAGLVQTLESALHEVREIIGRAETTCF